MGAYLTKTATEARNEEVSARIRGLLAIIGDLERVGDIFFQMSKQLERKMADRLWFSPEQRENLLGMMDLLDEAFAVMLRNLDGDAEKLSLDAAVEVEQRINRRRDKLRRAHLKSVETGSYNVKSGLIYSDLFSSCEKVGDHLINVSEALAGGVWTASAGNMAQGVAWSARKLGVPCTVIVPDTGASLTACTARSTGWPTATLITSDSATLRLSV